MHSIHTFGGYYRLQRVEPFVGFNRINILKGIHRSRTSSPRQNSLCCRRTRAGDLFIPAASGAGATHCGYPDCVPKSCEEWTADNLLWSMAQIHFLFEGVGCPAGQNSRSAAKSSWRAPASLKRNSQSVRMRRFYSSHWKPRSESKIDHSNRVVADGRR